MKNVLLSVFAAVIILIGLQRCTNNLVGNENTVTRQYAFKDFRAVYADTGCKLSLFQSDTFFVEVKVNANLSNYLDVKKENGALIISMKKGLEYTDLKFEAAIHLPALDKLDLSAGVTADFLNEIENPDSISFSVSDGSILAGAVSLNKLLCIVNSGGITTLSGTAETAELICAGGSIIQTTGLQAGVCDVFCSQGSIVSVNADSLLNVTASGGSTVNYTGTAQLGSVNLTEGSVLNRL